MMDDDDDGRFFGETVLFIKGHNQSCFDPFNLLVRVTHAFLFGVWLSQGNLPWSVNSDTLHDLFRDYNPLDVHVKTNMAGRSRGKAVVSHG